MWNPFRKHRSSASDESPEQAARGPQFKLSGVDLIVPIYLDSNVLLDLLASIEGGFSVVEKVTTRSASVKESELGGAAEGGTEFGVLNVLNLLKINVSGSLQSRTGLEAAEERQAERYHTYGSLLNRLRLVLLEQGALKVFDGQEGTWTGLQPSDFVELRGTFRPNPLADSLRMIDRLLDFTQLFSGMQLDSSQPRKAGKGGKSEQPRLKQIGHFIEGVLADLEREDVRLLVLDLLDSPAYHAVASLFIQYLRDRTMTELAHNEYRLLGKIVRKVSDSGSIDLLRGTALGGVGEEAVNQLTTSLNQLESLNLPRVETKIAAPALQVVPIAVYV